MNVNYERVCRLCLSSRSELLPIFPTTSSDDTDPPVLASKIKDCVSIQITENDDLPTNVCRKCMDNVNNWHIFKSVCERTQNKLQSLINKDGSQLEEVKIKSEPLSDEAYDDGVVIDGSYPDSENASSSKVQPEGPPILASLGLTPRSDKTYIDPRMDWQRVHAILNMVQDDDIIDSLQSTEECDILQHSDHDSETDSELQSDTNDMYIDSKNGYLCKNNKLLSKSPKTSSTLSYTKMREATKLRKRKIDVSKHCAGPKMAWQLLFTDDLLEQIVSSTNENLTGQGKSVTIPTTISEIKTLIGILYLHGVMRPTHQKCSDLWNNELGVPCVRNAMKYERFKFLLQNMCFGKNHEDGIIQLDIMKRIRKVFEIFAINCRAAYDIQNVVVVDEIIVPVYGPCPFRYEISKKPLKQGIKMVLLIDASNFYVSNLDVITDRYFRGDEILKKLVHHLVGSGKIIIMDSWFTSLDLVNSLKKEYQLYSIAAINPKDENVPPLFLSKYRKTRSFMSGFLDNDLCVTSYVDTQSKSINVLTNEPKFYKRGHVNHTTVVSMYKKNQSAVEVIDVLMHYYTTMQHSNDWTLSLFFTLLNISSVNAQVIWSSQNSQNVIQRRLFIKSLALSLLENEDPILQCSLSDIQGRKMKLNISPALLPYYKNRKRCRICIKTLKRDRRTKQCCVKCGQSICREHCVNICTMCAS